VKSSRLPCVAGIEGRLSELPRNKEIVAYCRGPYCVLAIDAVRLLRARGLRAHRLEASVQASLA
jgi:ArsR family transcriptional regulator